MRNTVRFLQALALTFLTTLTATAATFDLVISNSRTEDIYIYFSNTAGSITGTVGTATTASTFSGVNTVGGSNTITGGSSSVAAGSAIALSTYVSGSSNGMTTQTVNTTGYLIAAGSTNTFTLSNAPSTRVGFSLSDSLTDGTLSQFNNSYAASNLGDYTKRYDKVEIDYTGGTTATANLSATDFTGVPFRATTNDPNSAVQNAGWTNPYNTAIDNIVTNSINNTSSNNNGDALVTATSGGVNAGSGANAVDHIVRVIAPSTAVAGDSSPYNNIGNYVTHLQTEGTNIKLYSDEFGDFYDLSGTVTGGEVVMTGSIKKTDGTTADNVTLTIPASYIDNGITVENLDTAGIYGANPGGITVTQGGVDITSQVDVPSLNAAVRDFYAGVNLGAWGSTLLISGTGNPNLDGKLLGQLNSQELLQLADPSYFFSNAQSNDEFYNQYAQYVSENSDNSVYGFPYSDFLGGQLLTANSANTGGAVPTITLDIIPDAGLPGGGGPAIPEPATGALLVGSGLLLLLRRRKPLA